MAGNDLVLVRHAHTAQVGPDAKRWPLSERGRAEVGRLAAWSGWREVSVIVTSDEGKAVEAGAIIAVAHPHLRVSLPLAALGEVDRRGVFVADYEGAVAAFFAETEASPHGWEPAAARRRFVAAVEGVLVTHPDESVAVVAHGLVFALYLGALNGGPAATVERWRGIPFASVARVRRGESGGRTLLRGFMGVPSLETPRPRTNTENTNNF